METFAVFCQNQPKRLISIRKFPRFVESAFLIHISTLLCRLFLKFTTEREQLEVENFALSRHFERIICHSKAFIIPYCRKNMFTFPMGKRNKQRQTRLAKLC